MGSKIYLVWGFYSDQSFDENQVIIYGVFSSIKKQMKLKMFCLNMMKSIMKLGLRLIG